MKKRGKNLDNIFDIIISLVWGETLPARCREHKLHGSLEGYTECHIEGDWVLVYRISGEIITFAFTGTHSDYL